MIKRCTTVTGTVAYVRQEPDGDLHVNIKLAARYASMINSANTSYEHGDLVVEAICEGSITQADAANPCRGADWQVTTPAVGDRVRVTGSYVLDADHGWMEIHPASYIRILSAGVAPAPIAVTNTPPPTTASSGSGVSSGAGCHPTTSSGNCYEPGEFCSSAEHGETGVAGDGKSITCENTDPGSTWHWV